MGFDSNIGPVMWGSSQSIPMTVNKESIDHISKRSAL